MHTNKVTTKEKQENNEFKIQKSGFFFRERGEIQLRRVMQRALYVLAMFYCG